MDISEDFEVIKDATAPKGRRIIRREPKAQPVAKPLLVSDNIDLTDEQLRADIEELTGKKPHHKVKRENLIKMYKEAVNG